MSNINFKEIFNLYRSKILASLGAVIFIASGLVLYEFKFAGDFYNNYNNDDKDNAQISANSELVNNNIKISSSEDINYKNYTYESDYENTDKDINDVNNSDKNIKSVKNVNKKDNFDNDENNNNDEKWYLYITGSVRKPGVYQLPKNPRLFQLVDMAGGLNNFADTTAINLAEILGKDGDHIHIPSKSETKKDKNNELERRENKKIQNILIMDAETNKTQSQAQAKSKNKTQNKNKNSRREKYYERVNINTADAAELTKLRGIGPSLAGRIVDYRAKHGAFKSVNDLIKVRGIGDAKLKGLIDQAFIN